MDDSNKLQKRVLQIIVGVLALALLAGVWVIAGIITSSGEKNSENHQISQASQKGKIVTPSATPAPPGGVSSSSSSSVTPSGPETQLYGSSKDSSTVVNFGDKMKPSPDYGAKANSEIASNTRQASAYLASADSSYVGVNDLSKCYSTTKAYIICPVKDGVLMIQDPVFYNVYAIASTKQFSDADLAQFRLSYSEAFSTTGTGVLAGMYVITKDKVVDYS